MSDEIPEVTDYIPRKPNFTRYKRDHCPRCYKQYERIGSELLAQCMCLTMIIDALVVGCKIVKDTIKKIQKKYWYKIEIRECVLCCAQKFIKTRVYNKSEATHNTEQTACSEHFF